MEILPANEWGVSPVLTVGNNRLAFVLITKASPSGKPPCPPPPTSVACTGVIHQEPRSETTCLTKTSLKARTPGLVQLLRITSFPVHIVHPPWPWKPSEPSGSLSVKKPFYLEHLIQLGNVVALWQLSDPPHCAGLSKKWCSWGRPGLPSLNSVG